MSLNYLKCTASIYVVITIVQATKLRHDLEVRPRIFKIIEKNHGVILEKLEGEDYNEKGLVEFLKNNADLEYRVDNILNKRVNSNNRGPKKRLVKRIVQHGRYSPDVQYDKGVGTFFKPLVRIHKTIKLSRGARKKDRTHIVLANDAAIPKLGKLYSELHKLKRISNKYFIEEEQGRNKKRNRNKAFVTEVGHAIQHLTEIDNYMKHLHLPDLERSLRKKMHKHLQIINPEVEHMHREIISVVGDYKLLRGGSTPVEMTKSEDERSGEENDPYSAKTQDVNKPVQKKANVSELPCPLFPHQPLWNYWTYKDSISEDTCPEGTVRIGTICSHYPPHKK